MSRRIIIIIFFVATLLLSSLFVFNYLNSETRNISQYEDALLSYKIGDYTDAYIKFGKVSNFSSLKPASIFRQARCAENLQHFDVALKDYSKILNNTSATNISALSRYNMALIQYDMKNKKAKNNFKIIIKDFAGSELADISEYYLGLIALREANQEKNPHLKKEKLLESNNYFKSYIQKKNIGKYAKDAVQYIIDSELELSPYDNLSIARVFYKYGNYQDSEKYLANTLISDSWVDIAKNAFKLRQYPKFKHYFELGLKNYSHNVDSKQIYELVDMYLTTTSTKRNGLDYLIANIIDCNGFDYIMHLNCELKEGTARSACFEKLYVKYPTGQFSANALSEVFYSKFKSRKYTEAERIGRKHLRSFPNSNSAPFVTYKMGKVEQYLKNYESSTMYYKAVLSKYPDTYWAYRAYFKLNKNTQDMFKSGIKNKPVVFPYKKSKENNLVVKLALLKDYDLVEELCKNDKFVQSWIAYRRGNYTTSAILAREAMDSLMIKPPFSDLRWRLVYPVHYYEEINKYKRNNNPILLLSIMKEESHFNPNARSVAGALGLMQLMPATANETASRYGINGDLLNPETNIQLGSIYFSNIKETLGGKSTLAVLAYNGGYNAVNRWKEYLNYDDFDDFVEKIPYFETKNYLKKVLRTYWNYTNIY